MIVPYTCLSSPDSSIRSRPPVKLYLAILYSMYKILHVFFADEKFIHSTKASLRFRRLYCVSRFDFTCPEDGIKYRNYGS